jgi:hypothetical protein
MKTKKKRLLITCLFSRFSRDITTDNCFIMIAIIFSLVVINYSLLCISRRLGTSKANTPFHVKFFVGKSYLWNWNEVTNSSYLVSCSFSWSFWTSLVSFTNEPGGIVGQSWNGERKIKIQRVVILPSICLSTRTSVYWFLLRPWHQTWRLHQLLDKGRNPHGAFHWAYFTERWNWFWTR